MSIFHKPIKIRQQMQNTNCTRFVYRCIIMRDGFPRCRRVFHRLFSLCTAPLYFAKFTFSEIVCFAKRPSPRPAVLRRAVVSGGNVMIGTRSFCFAVPLRIASLCARRFCASFVQPCSSCFRVSCVCFTGFDELHRYLQSIIYPVSLLWPIHSLGCSQLCAIPLEAMRR